MKLIRQVKIKNNLGLHIRPAAAIVKLLQNTKAKVSFTYRKETINAKSIMSILMLAAKNNALITIIVEGTRAKFIMDKLIDFFEKGFGEE